MNHNNSEMTIKLAALVREWHKPPIPAERIYPAEMFRLSSGMIVKFEDGRLLLIGDANDEGGVCGCCGIFEPRYDDFVYGTPQF